MKKVFDMVIGVAVIIASVAVIIVTIALGTIYKDYYSLPNMQKLYDDNVRTIEQTYNDNYEAVVTFYTNELANKDQHIEDLTYRYEQYVGDLLEANKQLMEMYNDLLNLHYNED